MDTKIKIGHASISESGTVNGSAGDSTGYEVCIKSDFDITSKSYNIVLRPKSSALAEKSASTCEAGCANDRIGYSQGSRNTLYTYAKAANYDLSKVITKCNTDCSAFMTVCAIAGGANIEYGSNAPTTTTMRTRFKQSGDYTVLTDSKHTKQTDYLKRGDILVCEGSHTVMVLENGSSMLDDELETEEPTTPGVITTTVSITVRSIELSLENIEATKVSINIKAVEQKTGSAVKTMSANKIGKYTWTYQLENLSKSTSTAKDLSISSGKYTLSLNKLTPETTYAIQALATKNGKPVFSSQKMLFTTASDSQVKEPNKQPFAGDTINAINKIYIKANGKFHPAIIYKM